MSLAGVLGILLGVVAGLFVASFGFRRTLMWSLWLGAAMSLLQMLHLPFGLFLDNPADRRSVASWDCGRRADVDGDAGHR